MTTKALTLIGRSSSTFTRIARIFAAELHVSYAFDVVLDLQSLDPEDYGGNPALKVPSLRTSDATWFGALNVCREFARASPHPLGITWPEALQGPLLANMQELTLHAMSAEVGLIMSASAQPGAAPHRDKLTRSLTNTLSWLDANVRVALAALPPERDLSYLEVALFCVVAHLDFRKVLSAAPYLELTAFCHEFGVRASCRDTEYRFDA